MFIIKISDYNESPLYYNRDYPWKKVEKEFAERIPKNKDVDRICKHLKILGYTVEREEV